MNAGELLEWRKGTRKTTLLRLMAGVLRPKSGEVKFDIESEEDPRQKIGFKAPEASN